VSSIRISPDDDRILEKIRAKYIMKGIKLTKKEIVGQLIKKKAEELATQDLDQEGIASELLAFDKKPVILSDEEIKVLIDSFPKEYEHLYPEKSDDDLIYGE